MIGRNDPCWCGSGNKYKKCHLPDDLKRGASGQGKAPLKHDMSVEAIDGMRRAGAFNSELMDYVRPLVKTGVTTGEINRLVHEYTVERGHSPACLGYHGFPKSICTSVNDTVCHGIPSDSQALVNGDIVNVDLTTIVDGFHGDSSETFLIGEVSEETRHLVRVSAEALLRGIAAVAPGRQLTAVAQAVEPYVKSQGCSVVRQYTGHGIGRKFHQFFTVYHHVAHDDQHVILKPGMTLTVEPMINRGRHEVVTDRSDHWTVRTRDGSMSAQFEHTLLVTETGVEVLTLTPSQRAVGLVLRVAGMDLEDMPTLVSLQHAGG